jgi:putative transposase
MTTLEWFRQNRSSHQWQLKDMYAQLGISKQAHYKQVKRSRALKKQSRQIVEQVIQLRNKHPRMGARKLYSLMQPEGIGRDRFEKILFSNGLRLQKKKSYTRTTKRHPWLRYENLISGIRVKGPYEVLVSDITYIKVGFHDFHYLVLIQDVYTRKILGWSISDNLKAKNVVIALRRALKKIPQERVEGMIFHSDRGSQYLYGALLEIQNEKGIRPSMGNKAWENAHAESINGVLKEEYLNYLTDTDLEKMKRKVKVVIDLYNLERPHGSLNMMSPKKYEDFVLELVPEQRPIEHINY